MHQWAKNVLVFVPALTSQSLELDSLVRTISAFIAMSFCASSAYLLNDLRDRQADQQHVRKRMRPIAAGAVTTGEVVGLALLYLGAGLLTAYLVSEDLLAVVCVYYVATLVYSFWIKQLLLLDVVTLSLLYTVRIFVGATAIAVPVSHWLLTFSLLTFAALALIKRLTELRVAESESKTALLGRSYHVSDAGSLLALAASAGMAAMLVLALYVASPEIRTNYQRPDVLWLMCPIYLYWIGRTVLLANRGQMHDDPVVFALTDANSRVAALAWVALVLFAI
jgi:4-hydroxybenzoate polyprenyltransferase